MKYRVTEEETIAQGEKFRRNYPPFKPFALTDQEKMRIGEGYMNLFTTQNGQDFDDYGMTDHSDKTARYLPHLRPGDSILLLGTGTGREVLAAKSVGLKAIGTTFGSRNVAFAKILGLTDEEILEVACETLPFAANTFDAVAGYQIFEHTLSPLLFLLEQSRVLKMGGKLMLEWPPAKDYSQGDNPHHQVCFTPGQARALFEKAGFGDIKLYLDDMSPVAEEDMWRGDQTKMLCIEGVKVPCFKDYVLRHWASH